LRKIMLVRLCIDAVCVYGYTGTLRANSQAELERVLGVTALARGILPTIYSGVQVMFTVAFAAAFLGEAVGWDRAAGSAVTVAGVAMAGRCLLTLSNPR